MSNYVPTGAAKRPAASMGRAIIWTSLYLLLSGSLASAATLSRPAKEGYAYSVYLFPKAEKLGKFFCELQGTTVYFGKVVEVGAGPHPPINLYCYRHGVDLPDENLKWTFGWATSCPAAYTYQSSDRLCHANNATVPLPEKQPGECPCPGGNPINPVSANRGGNGDIPQFRIAFLCPDSIRLRPTRFKWRMSPFLSQTVSRSRFSFGMGRSLMNETADQLRSLRIATTSAKNERPVV